MEGILSEPWGFRCCVLGRSGCIRASLLLVPERSRSKGLLAERLARRWPGISLFFLCEGSVVKRSSRKRQLRVIPWINACHVPNGVRPLCCAFYAVFAVYTQQYFVKRLYNGLLSSSYGKRPAYYTERLCVILFSPHADCCILRPVPGGAQLERLLQTFLDAVEPLLKTIFAIYL